MGLTVVEIDDYIWSLSVVIYVYWLDYLNVVLVIRFSDKWIMASIGALDRYFLHLGLVNWMYLDFNVDVYTGTRT